MNQVMAVKVLAGLIGFQVLVGGVALATVEEPATLEAGSSSTTTTVPGVAAQPEGAPAPGSPGGEAIAPASGQPGGGPSPGAAPAPAPSNVDLNSLPERPTPTRPGSYTYRTKMDGRASASTFTTEMKEESESTLRYESAPAAGAEQRDRELTESSSDAGGMSFSGQADRERAWRGDGMYVTREFGSGEGGGESFEANCDWEPDVKELAFPLRQGATWSWKSSCESKSEKMDVNQTWEGTARVTGVQTASVGGREVRVLVIERQSVRTANTTLRREGREYQANSKFDEKTRQLYAPSVALTVRTDTEIKGTFESPGQPGGSGQFEGKGETELRSLDPK